MSHRKLLVIMATAVVLAGVAAAGGRAAAEPPVCLFWESAHTASLGKTITFDGGMSYDPDGDAIVQWFWDFGDGIFNNSGPLVSHAYTVPGVHIVCLTVTDAGGEISMCCEVKDIEPHAAPVPEFIRPIDEAWYDPGPDVYYPPVLTGDNPPFDNMVTLTCTEANGRTSIMNPDGTGDIEYCFFQYSPDGGATWYDTQPEAYDQDGTARSLGEPGVEQQYNCWEVAWDLNTIPGAIPGFDEGYLTVRVTMTDSTGYAVDSFFDVYCDLTPPKPDSLTPAWPGPAGGDYEAYDEGTVIPLTCHTYDQNVEEVAWYWQPIPKNYVKGVPLMNQRNPAWPTYCPVNDGAMWCVPTAHASCLKWWAANGFPNVWLAARPDWVNRWLLARFMGTSCFDGTTIAGQIRGARNWIRANGGGLVVTGPMRATPQRFIRELANCKEDVLLYWFWGNDPSDGGHEVTGNSFSTRRNPDGTWSIDYMDVATGLIVNTRMNAAGMIEVPPGSGAWYQAWMKTISPRRPPWPPFPPGTPWWPSCEVYPPILPCDILITEWDTLNRAEWSDPLTPMAAGLYLLKCNVIEQETINPYGDPERHMMSETTIVEIRDTPPACAITYEPPAPAVMESVQFHSNPWDGGNPDGLGMESQWDFGDGTTFGPGSDPFHEFVAPGDYVVTCTVTDDEGSSADCSTIVHVQLQPEPPVPKPIEPIDPAWMVRRPPLSGVVTLYCTEATGRTGVGAPVGSADIAQVTWEYGPPGGPYTVIGTDTDGMMRTESEDWPPISDPQYNWWSVTWDLTNETLPEDYYEVHVVMEDVNGQIGDSFFDVFVDVTPPEPEVEAPADYQVFDEGAIIPLRVHTWDENLVEVTWWWQPKQDWYVKGVPLLNQHNFGAGCANDGSMYCAPTAWASCLKWWAANGYPNLVPAGMTDAQLVAGLAAAMGTSCYDGTTVAGQVAGGRAWIAAHGGGLHVSGPSSVTPQGFRNEIENCKEDVLLGIYWDTGGGHRVTGNSFRNRGNSDGTWDVDYMDPSTGTIVTTKMRPNGQIEFPVGSGRWHSTDNMLTVSPDIPRGPWWPSCEVEPPLLPCDILITQWDLNDSSEWQDPTTPMKPGLYLLRCDMTDSTGHMMSDTRVIEIVDAPPVCAITYTPANPKIGDTVSFNANAYDPGGGAVTCNWTFGDGGSAAGCLTSHVYTAGGNYTVTVTVCDDEGTCIICTAVVRVSPVNLPPDCCFVYEPPIPTDATPVQFTDCSTDPDGDNIVSWLWDFGDGFTSNDQNPSHLFAVGSWNVCLTVTDDGEPPLEATCCQVIQVRPSGPQQCFTLQGNCWHMITLPCYAINPDPWEVFDELRPPNQPLDLLSGNLHRFNRNPDKYVTYWHSAPSEFGPITPGTGYWLWLFEDVTICYDAECTGLPERVQFPYTGWYMVGSPQPTDTFIDDTLWYQGGVGPLPFSAIMNVWVQDPLVGYRCQPPPTGYYTMGLLPIDEDHYLRAFQGYWMYAFEPDLIMEVPPGP
jgi:PKD repeat protein